MRLCFTEQIAEFFNKLSIPYFNFNDYRKREFRATVTLNKGQVLSSEKLYSLLKYCKYKQIVFTQQVIIGRLTFEFSRR